MNSTKEKSFSATLSISKRPMPGRTPNRARRRLLVAKVRLARSAMAARASRCKPCRRLRRRLRRRRLSLPPLPATAKKAARKTRFRNPISTRTIWRIPCRSPRSRPSSSRKCWRPSTPSPTHSTGSLTPSQERKYKKLKEEIIQQVKSLRLNQARIDALVEQLYDINKRLVSHEGRLLRLADSHGVVREDFVKNYQGSELDPRWLNRVSKLSAKGWK